MGLPRLFDRSGVGLQGAIPFDLKFVACGLVRFCVVNLD